jgi:chromosome segregation ATPase
MRRLGLAIAVSAWYLSAAPVLAQVQRSGNDAARVMQQVQQLTAERNTLQSSNDDLRKQLADLKAQLAQLGKQSSAQQAKLRTKCAAPAASARDTQATQESAAALEKSKERLQQLLTRFRESTATLAGVETERNNLNAELATTKLELGNCIERNVGLYELSQTALDRLGKRGFWTRLAEQEPFTRVQRTRLDNLIDDDRQRALNLRVPPRKSDSAAKP